MNADEKRMNADSEASLHDLYTTPWGISCSPLRNRRDSSPHPLWRGVSCKLCKWSFVHVISSGGTDYDQTHGQTTSSSGGAA